MAEPPITQGEAYAPASRREPRPPPPPPPASPQPGPQSPGGGAPVFAAKRRDGRKKNDQTFLGLAWACTAGRPIHTPPLRLRLGQRTEATGAARSPSRQTARGQSRPPPRRPSPRAATPCRPPPVGTHHRAPQLPAGLRPLAQTAAPPQCRTLPAPACRAPLAAPCRLARTSQAPALQAAGH